MSGLVVGEVDAILYSEDGKPLDVTPDAQAPTDRRALFPAGVEVGDQQDTARLMSVDKNGGMNLSLDVVQTLRSIRDELGMQTQILSDVRSLLAAMAED